ncbi:MAG: hypothetical protein ACLP5H_00230 [Desulfomonilaceae bacterium]
MKKILLLAFVLGAVFPAVLLGQNISPSLIPTGLPTLPPMGEDSTAGTFLSSLPLIKGLKQGKVLLNPFVQIGYQHIGANMSIPIQSDTGTPAGQLQIGTIDVALNNFDFWSGSVGLNVVTAPFTLFGSVGGFSPHAFTLSGQIPISLGGFGGIPVFQQTASNFEFWTVQGGAAYEFKGGYSILAGFMWSHMEVEFGPPSSGSVPSSNQTIRADMLMKIGVPFIGIQAMQPGYYRAALLYSPLAWSQGALDFRSSQTTLVDLRYSLNQPGQFLAVIAEYFFPMKPPAMLSAWFNGSLVNIRGTSDLEFTSAGPADFRTKDVLVTNTQTSIGGGIPLGVAF